MAGGGRANRDVSPCIPLDLSPLTLPLPWMKVPTWSAVFCLWDGTKLALLAATWSSEAAQDWHPEMPSDHHT